VKVVPPGQEEGVLPSAETVVSGAYTPLSRPLFIYASKQAAERPEVAKFVEFYLGNAAALASEVQYVPLPEGAYATVKERFAQRQTGSAFGGEPEVGLPIEEILERTPTH
jgi:phosphate transport system substrate-binding protein